jgi:hypothetical protein
MARPTALASRAAARGTFFLGVFIRALHLQGDLLLRARKSKRQVCDESHDAVNQALKRIPRL